jgi:competence protein ComEC
VTFADVGQGDAALIGTPSGRNILIDGGPSPARLVRLLGNKLSFWDRSIDLVVLTHPHEDHVSGLTEALRKYEIEHVLGPEVQYDSPAHEDWRGAVRSEGARVIRATAGQTIDFGDGVLIQVLNPPERRLEGTVSDLDNASVVVRMVYGDVSFLFTGDVFSEAEAWLVGTDAPIDSDVLKVAHHGSRSSSGEEFVEKVSPVAAVISVGEKNRHGHPHAETLETLHRHVASALVFETMEVGYIEFVTDGRTLEVTTER